MKHNAACGSRLLGLTALFVLVSIANADAYRVRLTWRPVSGAAGYRLYARQNGYPDPVVIDIGQPTADGAGLLRYEHSGLLVESTNAFSLATYDGARVESPRSNELSVAYAVAATIVDSDADGLTDAREDINLNLTRESGETDRLRADTDGDGASDGVEVAAGSDPLNAASRPGTATPTQTATAVRTATRSATPLPTRTPTRTATPVSTRTGTPILTATRSATATPARTTTASPVRTGTATPPLSATPTPEPTPTRSPTPAAPLPTATTVANGALTAPLILSIERID